VTRKRRTTVRIDEDGEPGAFSSPACYLHEFETAPATTPGVQIKRIHDERSDEGDPRINHAIVLRDALSKAPAAPRRARKS
jgi:hypothetical protein